MKTIILNENTYALERLRTKTPGENIYNTLQILSKYYYWKCEYRAARIEKALMQFLEEAYPEYHVSKWQWEQTVERLSRRAGKYPIYEINEIWITENELKILSSIPDDRDYKYQKLAFSFLVLAKYFNMRKPNNNGWVNTEVKDVFEMANVKVSSDERYIMLGRLDRLGITEDPKKNDNLSSRVTFIDDKSDKVFSVSDFRDLGYEYLRFLGKGYVRCVCCGKLMKDNKEHTKKYCKDCAGNVPDGMKPLICIDCGEMFYVSIKNNKSKRCSKCQVEEARRSNRERMQNLRAST